MLFTLLICAAIIVVVFIIVVSVQPAAFRITRSLEINASAAVLFEHVSTVKRWKLWSPWDRLDPEMKQTYEGPESGVGAGYSWEGNNKVGAGRLTEIECKPYEICRFELEFLRPMAATHYSEFTFTPQATGTLVTWSMTGENSFMGKAFSMFVDMDKMVGGQFDEGLKTLKTICEIESGTNSISTIFFD